MKKLTTICVLFFTTFILLPSTEIRIDKIESKKSTTINSLRDFSQKLGLFSQPAWPKEKQQIAIVAKNNAILIEFEVKKGQNFSSLKDSNFNQSLLVPTRLSQSSKERTPT